MTIDVTQFHQVFFEESLEHLANMESCLLQLETGEEDSETINVIFRGAHSIKGGSATFGFQSVAGFTHLVETLLERIRSNQMAVHPGVITVLLESVDVLREMIESLKGGDEIDAGRHELLQQQLSKVLEIPNAKDAPVAPLGDALAAPPDAVNWQIDFRPHSHLFQTGNDPHRIIRELETLGPLDVTVDISKLPNLGEMAPEECYLGWTLVVKGGSREAIDEVFAWLEGDCDLKIEAISREDGAQKAPAFAPETTSPKNDTAAQPRRQGKDRRIGEGESIRVGIEKIDSIINMVGELVITQSMICEASPSIQGMFDSEFEGLRDGLIQLERNIRELQEGVMRIRMVPISFAFQRFPRLVHDLSQKLGKKVELTLSGEQTELDKTVMEKISDPLVHLVRNALDHAIETPDTRRSLGKPEIGRLHLNAFHQGGNIVIEVSDDGSGLNHERIVAKARERGLLSDADELNDDRIADLIFEPGFSTAKEISDISGRGVGMDVVKRNINDLGGSIEVRSETGKGSRFTIRLPLTLSILDGQLIRVGAEVYIAPLISIVESLQMRSERIKSVAGCPALYRLRDEYIPMFNLKECFEIDANDSEETGELLVVVEAGGKKVGLIVDDLLGQQQVVVKSLDTSFGPVPCVSGATILGDGNVALILDAAELVTSACGKTVEKQRLAS